MTDRPDALSARPLIGAHASVAGGLATGGLASILSFRLLAAPVAQARGLEKNGVTSLLASSSMIAK